MNENMENPTYNETPNQELLQQNESPEILLLQEDAEKELAYHELSNEEREKVQGIIEDSATINLLAEEGSREAKIAAIGNSFLTAESPELQPSLANKAIAWAGNNIKKMIAVGTIAVAAAGPMGQANAGSLTDIVVNEGIHQVDIKSRGVERSINKEAEIERQNRDFEMRIEESRQRMENNILLRERHLNEECQKQVSAYNLKRKIWEEGKGIDPSVSNEEKIKERAKLEDERKRMLGQQDMKWNTLASQVQNERMLFENRIKEEQTRFAHNVERGRDDVDRDIEREQRNGVVNAGGQIVREAVSKIFRK